MPSYLIDCPCGSQLTADPSLAGQSIACPECQQAVEVPSLRLLKNLPLAASEADQSSDSKASKKPAVAWEDGDGQSTFIRNLGAILVILSVVALFVLVFVRVRSITGATPEDNIQFGDQMIDQLTPFDSLEMWKEIQKSGMGAREMTLPRLEQRRIRVLNVLMIVAGAMGIAGIAMALFGGTKKTAD